MEIEHFLTFIYVENYQVGFIIINFHSRFATKHKLGQKITWREKYIENINRKCIYYEGNKNIIKIKSFQKAKSVETILVINYPSRET